MGGYLARQDSLERKVDGRGESPGFFTGKFRKITRAVAGGLLGAVLFASSAAAVEQRKSITSNGSDPGDGNTYNNRTYSIPVRENGGYAVAIGDFNGDGTGDVVVLASGAAYGFAGVSTDTEGGTHVVQSTNSGEYTWNITLPVEWYSPFQLKLANVNGDTNGSNPIDDIIIGNGAEDVDPGTGLRIGAGKISVIRGGSYLAGVYDFSNDSQLAPENKRTIIGDDYYELGGAIAAGDVNQDGIADIAASADVADAPTGGRAGRGFLIPGASAFFDRADIDLRSPPANVTEFRGTTAGDRFGLSVAIGDSNGDGNSDLHFGAVGANSVYRWLSRTSWNATYTADQADNQIRGRTGGILGYPLNVVKVESGQPAFILAGDEIGNTDTRTEAGVTYGVRNDQLPALPSIFDLQTNDAHVRFDGAGGSRTIQISHGDASGDGLDDLVFRNGRLWFGRAVAAGTVVDISAPADMLYASAGARGIGMSFAIGRYNSSFHATLVGIPPGGAALMLPPIATDFRKPAATDCWTEIDTNADGVNDAFSTCWQWISESVGSNLYRVRANAPRITDRSWCGLSPDAENPGARPENRFKKYLDDFLSEHREGVAYMYIAQELVNSAAGDPECQSFGMSSGDGETGQRRPVPDPRCVNCNP